MATPGDTATPERTIIDFFAATGRARSTVFFVGRREAAGDAFLRDLAMSVREDCQVINEDRTGVVVTQFSGGGN
jgi:hypothetical protein